MEGASASSPFLAPPELDVGIPDGDLGGAVDVGVAGVVGDLWGSCIESSLSLFEEPLEATFKFVVPLLPGI